ncbi:Trm112 family protein [Sphingomonas sp. S1-29]|uniref:Trm112 family protein n=1 Tax=Sphingomonas sp. S1-29 TaxID=2991074 RepID=UPI00223FBDAD|nr:Trm112 family protein [Sphingomonas sp. S1-29]UZK68533.1 Trm112 family protein [Sphingomonas sp. S1-29]
MTVRARSSELRPVSLDPWLLSVLVCPATRTPLRYDEAAGELVSEAAGLAYPIRDGVPVMLVEAARVIAPANL